jgi:hypothetical protein
MTTYFDLVVSLIARQTKASYNVHAYYTLLHRCNRYNTTQFLYICTFHDSFLGCQLFPSLLRSGAIRYNLIINILTKTRKHGTAENIVTISSRCDNRYR